jgi:methenyltetrahydrofolate cyclohydrolase
VVDGVVYSRRVNHSDAQPGTLASHTLHDLLESIAAKTPAPGGGAVACAAGAVAAALAGMVVSYSVGKKDLAEHQEELTRARDELARARALLLGLADEDAAAYGLMNALQKLPAGDVRREREMPGAAAACVQIPLASVAVCVDVLRLMERLTTRSNRWLRSDLAIAAILAESAARSGAWNVRINLGSLADEAARRAAEEQLAGLLNVAAAAAGRVQTACAV